MQCTANNEACSKLFIFFQSSESSCTFWFHIDFERTSDCFSTSKISQWMWNAFLISKIEIHRFGARFMPNRFFLKWFRSLILIGGCEHFACFWLRSFCWFSMSAVCSFLSTILFWSLWRHLLVSKRFRTPNQNIKYKMCHMVCGIPYLAYELSHIIYWESKRNWPLFQIFVTTFG